MDDCIFAQMTRAPQPGQVKTRLLSQLSPQQAADLHVLMTSWVYDTLQSVSANTCLWVEGSTAAFAAYPGEVFRQQGSDLGERMQNVCQWALAQSSSVVLVGSDCPSMDAGYLKQAQRALASVDVVFGPALDGGYVLIGMKRNAERLFSGISWGQATVLEESIAVVKQLGWSYQLLVPLADVDYPEDLAHLPQSFRATLPPGLLPGE